MKKLIDLLKKIEIYFYTAAFLFFAINAYTSIDSTYRDGLYLFSVIMFCLITFWIVRNISTKKFAFWTLLFCILHGIIFPLLYVGVIKENINSFSFNDEILKIEKENYRTEVEYFYNKNSIEKQLKVISNLLSSNDKRLNEPIDIDSTVIIDSYELRYIDERESSSEYHKFPRIHRKRPESQIEVYEKSNNQKVLIIPLYGSTKRELFKNQENYLNKLKADYLYEVENLKINSVWSYSNILPYSLNIFFNGNLTPITRIANFIFFFHNLIVYGFVIMVLGSILPIKENRED